MHLDTISHLPQGLRSVLLCSGPQTKILVTKFLIVKFCRPCVTFRILTLK